MSCYADEFIIDGDVNDKLKKEIKKLTQSPILRQTIASKINNGSFEEWVKENYLSEFKEGETIIDKPANTIGKYLRHYVRTHFAKVSNGAKENQNVSTDLFTSVSAKKTAIVHTAFLISSEYYRIIQQPADKRPKRSQIGRMVENSVIKLITNEFDKRAKSYFEQHSDEAFAKTYFDKLKEYNDLKAEQNNIHNEYLELYNSGKRQEAETKYQEEVEKYNECSAKLEELRSYCFDILSKADEITLRNYAALYKNVTSKEKNIVDRFGNELTLSESFFQNVYSHKSLLSIKSIFEDEEEYSKAFGENEEDGDDNTEQSLSEEDIDMMAAQWDNYIYSNYIKNFDASVRLYLSNILASTIKYDNYEEGKGYDTENDLGVALPMNDRFVVTQITNGASFYSIPDFIYSVKKLANTIPSLYGLSRLVKDMENDEIFARRIFVNFAKPVWDKAIIDVQRTGSPKMTQSNSTAKAYSKMFYDLLNTVKLTYKDVFDERDSIALLNIKSDKSYTGPRELIYDIIHKYFPNLDKTTLESILYKSNSATQEAFIDSISKSLKLLIDKLSDIVKQENKVNAEYASAMREYDKALEAWQDPANPNRGKKPEKPEYDSSYITYETLNQPLIEISELITPYYTVNTELNSLTATGTISSNMIKESYLTNFIKQLNYTLDTPGGELEGVKLLKEFLTQSNSFYYNNILFGVKDDAGNIIREGLFFKSGSVITVNPKAKDLIKSALFDGVRNRNALTGTNYRNMTQGDYFLSMIIAYNTPINYDNSIRDNELIGNSTKGVPGKLANIMLRIPSDASNNFMVQLLKYSYSGEGGLYSYTSGVLSSKIAEIVDDVETKYNNQLIKESRNELGLPVTTNEYDKLTNDYFISTANVLKANKPSEQFITEILYNGGIKGEVNLNSYTRIVRGEYVYVPIIYKKPGTGVNFVIYLKGKYDKQDISSTNLVIDNISALSKHTEKVAYTDISEALDYIHRNKEKEVLVYDDPSKVINAFLTANSDRIINLLYDDNKIEKTTNRNSAIFRAFRNEVIGEINDIVRALNALFKWNNKTKKFELIDSTENLFEWKHYTGGKVIDDNGHLTGKVFTPAKLFAINGFSVTQELLDAISLYGEQGLIKTSNKGKTYYLNLRPNSFIRVDPIEHELQLNIDRNGVDNIVGLNDIINDVVEKWLLKYDEYIKTQLHKYDSFLANAENISFDSAVEAMFNITLAYMDFDAIFEGDSKFYKDAQTFLKRAKEVQMAGSSYAAYDFSDGINGDVHTIKDVRGNDIEVSLLSKESNDRIPIILNGTPLKLETGFRAVTIANTIRGFERATELYNEIYEENYKKFIADGLDEESAKRVARSTAEAISKGYGDFIVDGQQHKGSKTKINDAQSYITIYELARRRFANGTIDEFSDLIAELIKPENEFDITKIDMSQLQKFIQAQKNVYYDIQFDRITKEYYPRQIKNAEFVLIPNLLPKGSDLRILADIMIKYNIQQVNTAETSKAANKNVLTFWDSSKESILHTKENEGQYEGIAFEDAISDDSNVEVYFYRNLHQQQDIVDHMVDRENKLGIQIAKKIQDNADSASKTVRDAVERLQKALSFNIEHDFRALIFQFGWTIDDTGQLCNIGDNNPETKYNLNFEDFYARAREEAQRLDMDSNFLEYLLPDKQGNVDMPNYLGVVGQKLESIAQSIFNRSIARQTLPGWHAVQVTTVGYSNDLQYHPEVYVNINDPRKEISAEEFNALKKEEKVKYQKVAYVDALIPVWDSKIEELIETLTEKYGNTNEARAKAEQEVIDKLNKANLDKQIGYRIPTEGKQSITILRIKGFLPRVYGSTIIVANEWVTQTGADFDIDTIYGIYHELKVVGDNIFKIEPNYKTDEYNTKLRYTAYINELLRESKARTKDYVKYAKSLRDEAYDKIEAAREAKKHFNEINERIKATKQKLDKPIRKVINSALSKFTKNTDIDDVNKDKRIIDRLNTFIQNDFKENQEVIDVLNELIDLYTERILFNEDYRELDLSLFDKTDDGHNAFLTKANEDYFDAVDKIAKEAGLISYDEFKDFDIIAQQTTAARNNIIVDAMLEIMSDPTSREENYSRSNFDDITDEMGYLNDIAGTGFGSASTYNPFDQLRFMQNAIDGRKLKAFSVNRDTFNSVNNRLKTLLNGNHAIKIKYDLSLKDKEGNPIYDIAILESAFDEVETINEDSNDFVDINKEFLSKINYIPYKRTGDIINSISKGENICLATQMLCIEMIGDAFNNGDIAHNVKAWPVGIWAKSPVTDDNISHETTLVNINGIYYLFDMPQSEFIIPTGNTFKENGEVHKEAEIKEFKPRLIPITKESLQSTFNIDDEHIDNTIKNINDIIAILNKKSDFKINIEAKKQYAIVTHRSIGWSKNNRNVVGKLLTSYSSQTTAHILDAIKEGAIYNETDYTFGTFKTLVDVGIDYGTAIAFLMQPTITRLNEYHSNSVSIFSNKYDNPIRYFIKDFAKELNNPGITDNSTYDEIIESFAKNEELQKEFEAIWGTKITKDLFDTDIIIEKLALQNRLIENKNGIANNAFDLGILIAFNKYNRTTRNLETISRCANPDSFGAKQTIHDTRVVVDNVLQHYSYDDFVGKTLVVGKYDDDGKVLFAESYDNEYNFLKGVRDELEDTEEGEETEVTEEQEETPIKSSKSYITFLQALYPGFGDRINIADGTRKLSTDYRKDVDVEKSRYKYLAAIFKYCTNKSIQINSRLFDFESEDMDRVIRFIENRFGRNFKSLEYAEFKKYMISTIYNDIPFLNSLLTINEHGQVVIADSEIDFENDYWNTERNRIFGYKETVSDFSVKDIGNITPEELSQYIKLTPLQKVMFIKKYYVEDAGIFSYIDCTKYNKNELESKGYSKNRLTINTDGINIEELFILFDEAFFNNDKIVKLAAIDLIKYAFIVEGFNFKRNSISKIITNQSLLAGIEKGGLNLVNSIKNEVKDIRKSVNGGLNDILTDKYLRNFVRSHSDLLQTIKLDKPEQNQKASATTGNLFLSAINKEHKNLVMIPVQEAYKPLIEALQLDSDKTSQYIKIGFYDNVHKGKYTEYLYEVNEITNSNGEVTYIALIPLNYLDSTENTEISLNNDNHEHYTYQYYKDIINELNGIPVSNKLSLKEAKIPTYKFTTNIDYTVDINFLMDSIATGQGVTQAQAKKFTDDIAKWYKEYGGVVAYGIIQNGSSIINKLFKSTNSTIQQNIDIGDGIIVKFNIKKNPDNNDLIKLHKYYLDKGFFPKGTPKWKIEYHDSIIWNDVAGKHPSFYKISVSEEKKSSDAYKKQVAETTTEKRRYDASRIRYIDNSTFSSSEEFTTFDKIANLIIRDIEYKAHKGEDYADDIYEEFYKRGIATSSLKDISKRSKDIYYIASTYYTTLAEKLLNALNNFEIDGVSYSLNPNEKVDGKSLYDALREHSEKRDDFFKMLLEAKTFGDGVYEILQLPITGEDPVLDSSIKKIQQSINNVRNNNNLKIAFDAMFNYYLAKEYSENPNVRQGLLKITDIFGDIDWWDTQFSDVAELNHKQIQVVVKMANDIVAKAHFEGLDRVKEFKKEWARIISQEGTFDINHIIDSEGRFISPISSKFYEDRRVIWDKFRETANTYGFHSKEYFLAELEKDKWNLAHTEQEIVDDYYRQDIALREQLFSVALDYYVEYRQLLDKIYSNYIPYNQLTEAQKKERQRYWDRINELRKGKLDEFGEFDSSYNAEKSEALDNYIKSKFGLNSRYFHTNESKEFREVLEYNLGIIEQYDAAHPTESIEHKLANNEEYRDAYEWIKGNTHRKLTPELQIQLTKAFAALGGRPEYKKAMRAALDVVPEESRTDIYGDIIGTKYTIEQQEHIKQLLEKRYNPYGEFDEEGNLVHNTMNELYDSRESDNGLLKEVSDVENVVFKDEFYRKEVQSEEEQTPEVRRRKREIYTKINSIISKAFDSSGRFDVLMLYQSAVDEEGNFNPKIIEELANLYQELRILNKAKYDKVDEGTKSVIELRRNDSAKEREAMKLQKIPAAYRDLFKKIIYDRKADPFGTLAKEKGKKLLANRFLFGYYAPLKVKGIYPEKYVDKTKTEARKFLNERVRYEETEYLYEAMRAAEAQGTEYYNRWLEANRVYNPYKRVWEWIPIWTRMTIVPVNNESVYEWEPIPVHRKREINDGEHYDEDVTDVVENALNPLYRKGGTNYRTDDTTYINPSYANLSDKELELLKYLQDIVNFYATNYKAKEFVNQGFVPRVKTITPDKRWYAKQVAGAVGLQTRNYNDREWHDIIDFSHDFDATFDMFTLIKGVGTKKYIPIPPKDTDMDEEQYKKLVDGIREQNRKIQEKNLRIDNDLMNRDYEDVFSQLIYNGTEYQAREKTKDLIYVMIEDLKSRTANKVNNFGKLSRNRRRSTTDYDSYNQVAQDNAYSVFVNWARRFLFKEYKNRSPLNKYSDLLQNITSAKFMIFNLLGGVANINTGLVNILGEGFANEFFSNKEFRNAAKLYLSKSPKMIADFFDVETNDFYVGLTKYFDVVDYDQILELAKDADVVERSKKINRFLYSFQSGGEHFMQNSALFAMLESHRLYREKDKNGNPVGPIQMVTFGEYNADVDIRSFEQILREHYPNLLTSFKFELNMIQRDKSLQEQYDRFKRDPIADFIRGISDKEIRTNVLNLYNEARKNNTEIAKQEFAKMPTVMSQLELHEGEIRIKPIKVGEEYKPNDLLTDTELGKLKWKVQQVNDKIHGVYNKMGGARIEQYWFGNLIMQYHKHLYPGIMKRFRVNGMFNETRGTIDFGSYISAFKLAANVAKDVFNPAAQATFAETTEEDAIKSFGTFASRVFDIANIISFEWHLLPTWEKNNIKRCIGDLCGIGAAFLLAFAIYLMTDDDDLKDDNFIGSCLYIADRLLTESKMYTITGLYSEGATLWSSPIAGLSTIKDLFKVVDLGTKYLIDPSFEVVYPNGLYKGKNKFGVVIQRNIPGYRIIKRIENIAKNNNYYRLNESTVSTRLAKTLADEITEED